MHTGTEEALLTARQKTDNVTVNVEDIFETDVIVVCIKMMMVITNVMIVMMMMNAKDKSVSAPAAEAMQSAAVPGL